MQFTFALSLPSDALSVPLARHLTRRSLLELGVAGACADAIELAMGEACANVLQHAGTDGAYEVRVEVDDRRCTMRIIDAGDGFDPDQVAEDAPDALVEQGRGLGLMRELVDILEVDSRIEHGTEVVLEKELSFDREAVLPRLSTPQ